MTALLPTGAAQSPALVGDVWTGISIVGTAMVSIMDLSPYPHNPRMGDVDEIARSIRKHGIFRHLVVNKRNNQVLAGNHTFMAAHQAGLSVVPVSFVDVDDEEAAQINLVDNRMSDIARYDLGLLTNLLQSLPDLDGTGYDQEALDALLADVGSAAESEMSLDDLADIGQPVLQYNIVFDNEAHQKRWFGFLRWLKTRSPEYETVSARLNLFLQGLDGVVPVSGGLDDEEP